MRPRGQDMKRLRLISHMAYLLLELSDKYEDEFESCMKGALRQNF